MKNIISHESTDKFPLASTITLAYNVEPFIENCINSIISQSYLNIEIIIVVNGKSKDSTHEIVNKIASLDSRIKLVFNEKNSIIGDGRICGLNAVSGEFFTFIDGDDFLPSDAIMNLINAAIETQSEVVVGSIQQVSVDGEPKGIIGMPDYTTLSPREYIPKSFTYIDTYLHGKLYKTILFRENEIFMFPDNYLGEDKMLHIQFCTYANKIIRCEEVVHFFRDNPNSITKQIKYKDFESEYRNLLWMHNLFSEKDFFSDKEFRDSYKSHLLYILYYCFFTGGLKVFKQYPNETTELLYGDYLKNKFIRDYLKQWKLYVPTLELYRFNKYLGALLTFSLNRTRSIIRKIQRILK
jgi:glycosyltransferase involved in cell wall biosynthesis